MVSIILSKEKLLWLYSEFALPSFCCCEGLCITNGLVKMPGIFGKINFAVHSLCNFLIIDLLLYVKFR